MTAPPPQPNRRADQLEVVRRVALPGWDVTFLVTDAHLRRYRRDGLVDFLCRVGARRAGGQRVAAVLTCGKAGLGTGAATLLLPRPAVAALPTPLSSLLPALLLPACLQFVSDLHSEVSAMKLALRSRARAVAADYWRTLEARRLAPDGDCGGSSGGGGG